MNETKSARYQRLRRRAGVAGTVSGVSLLALLALTPVGDALAAGLAVATGHAPVVTFVAFVTALVLLWEVAVWPARWRAARAARRYGVPDASSGASSDDRVLSMLATLPLVVGVAAVVSVAGRIDADRWWLWTGLTLTAAGILAARLVPAHLARVSGARPVTREPLAGRLRALADGVGLPVQQILEAGDERPGFTAMIGGWGTSRRILVSSEVLRDWSDEEIEIVVAHELGHGVHRDTWWSLGLDAVLLVGALAVSDLALRSVGPVLGLEGVAALRALPFVALTAGIAWLAATPIRLAQSRRHERRADAFALSMTGSVDAFDTAIRRLGQRFLAEEQPSFLARWLFHRHPPVGERLEYARTHRKLVA